MTRWIVPIRLSGTGRIRLICFPFGGAGTAPFWSWQSALPDDVELFAIRLPGRESRTAEGFVVDPTRIVESIATELRDFGDGSFVFYGHSLGAALAVETADLLRQRNENQPALLILSGR